MCVRYREVNLQCSYQALDVCVPVNVVLVTQLVEVSLSEHDTSRMLSPQAKELQTKRADLAARVVQILLFRTYRAADCNLMSVPVDSRWLVSTYVS
jgi:hypothetical protein